MTRVREIGRGVAGLQRRGRAASGEDHADERDRKDPDLRAEDHQQRPDDADHVGQDEARAPPGNRHQARDRDRDDRRADHGRGGRESAERLGSQVRGQQRANRRPGRHADPAQDLCEGEGGNDTFLVRGVGDVGFHVMAFRN